MSRKCKLSPSYAEDDSLRYATGTGRVPGQVDTTPPTPAEAQARLAEFPREAQAAIKALAESPGGLGSIRAKLAAARERNQERDILMLGQALAIAQASIDQAVA